MTARAIRNTGHNRVISHVINHSIKRCATSRCVRLNTAATTRPVAAITTTGPAGITIMAEAVIAGNRSSRPRLDPQAPLSSGSGFFHSLHSVPGVACV